MRIFKREFRLPVHWIVALAFSAAMGLWAGIAAYSRPPRFHALVMFSIEGEAPGDREAWTAMARDLLSLEKGISAGVRGALLIVKAESSIPAEPEAQISYAVREVRLRMQAAGLDLSGFRSLGPPKTWSEEPAGKEAWNIGIAGMCLSILLFVTIDLMWDGAKRNRGACRNELE